MNVCDLKKLADMILKVYDPDIQPIICIEELSELQKEICKATRYETEYNKAHLAEEISHCLISIHVIKQYYDIKDKDIEKEILKKFITVEAEEDRITASGIGQAFNPDCDMKGV